MLLLLHSLKRSLRRAKTLFIQSEMNTCAENIQMHPVKSFTPHRAPPFQQPAKIVVKSRRPVIWAEKNAGSTNAYRSFSSFNSTVKVSVLPAASPVPEKKPSKVDYYQHFEGNGRESWKEETRRVDLRLPLHKAVPRALVPLSLRNLGNTCFVNAALNGLFALDTTRQFFLGSSSDSESLACAFRQLFERSQSIEGFIRRLRGKLGDFLDSQQHCAHTFLLRLFAVLDKELPSAGQATSAVQDGDIPLQRYRSNKCAELHDALSVLTENLFICKKCTNLAFRNYSYSRTLDLPVPVRHQNMEIGVNFGRDNFYLSDSHMKYRSCRETKSYLEYFHLLQKDFPDSFLPPKRRNLTTCFKFLLRATLMSPGNEFPCEKCGCDTQHYKQSFLRHISPVLILHFQLFDESTSGKLRVDIKFDLCLDLSPYLASEGLYDLKAVIYHMGSLYYGHYTATIRLGERWFSCDDERVTKVSEPQTENAYLLFYEKRALA